MFLVEQKCSLYLFFICGDKGVYLKPQNCKWKNQNKSKIVIINVDYQIDKALDISMREYGSSRKDRSCHFIG